LKLKPKFLGPYRIIKIKPYDTYDVVKMGGCEGPAKTTTCAEYLKRWAVPDLDESTSSGEEGQTVGSRWMAVETKGGESPARV